MLERLGGAARITVGADRGYDTNDFVEDCRNRGVSPPVAQHTSRRPSAMDERTTRHVGYTMSQRIRRRIESIFGWMKTTGGFGRARVRGLARSQLATQLVDGLQPLRRGRAPALGGTWARRRLRRAPGGGGHRMLGL